MGVFNYKDIYCEMKQLIRHILREHTREIGEGKKVTTDDFIEKARKIHGDRYDYSKSEYIAAKDLITITCPIHGDTIDESSCCHICEEQALGSSETLTGALKPPTVEHPSHES